jgi:hypothetical protein
MEVVRRVDQPATEQTPWGKAFSKNAREAEIWLTWVFATYTISVAQGMFERPAIADHRTRSDRTDLKWKQISH